MIINHYYIIPRYTAVKICDLHDKLFITYILLNLISYIVYWVGKKVSSYFNAKMKVFFIF